MANQPWYVSALDMERTAWIDAVAFCSPDASAQLSGVRARRVAGPSVIRLLSDTDGPPGNAIPLFPPMLLIVEYS